MAVAERTAQLCAREVAVTVPARRILEPTSLTVAPGELVALIGPSGSGKTTLLRTLAGVAEPTAGTVTLGEDPVAERMPDIGYLPDGDLLHEPLTVREALRYAGLLRLPRETGPDELEQRIDAVLDELRLSARGDATIASLSGGERKRAGCALELIGDPTMLLLDEPATGLDPGLERRLMAILRRLADGAGSAGRGVLVVTHATSSLALCDGLAVLGPGGRLRFAGPPSEAPAHFGVDSFEAIYATLEEEAERRTDGDARPGPEPVVRPRRRRPRAPIERPFGLQAHVVADRYARCLARDQRTLALLIGQAPLIGLLIGLALPRNVLGQSDLAPFYTILLGFMLLTASNWLGVITSCREIVKERSIVEREAGAGLRLDAYLFAKVVVLLPLCALQAALLVAVAVLLQPLHASASAYLQVGALCVLAAWASAGLGLLVSALARCTDQATPAIPLLMIPQLLLGGAIIPTSVMPAPIEALSHLAHSSWGLSGIGSTLSLDTRLSEEISSAAGYRADFFTLQFPSAALVLGLFCSLALAGAALALDRSLGR